MYRFKKIIFFYTLFLLSFSSFAHTKDDKSVEALQQEFIDEFSLDDSFKNPYFYLDKCIKNYIFFGEKIKFDSFGHPVSVIYKSEDLEGKRYYEMLMDQVSSWSYADIISRIKRIKFSAIFYNLELICSESKRSRLQGSADNYAMEVLSSKSKRRKLFKESFQRKKYIQSLMNEFMIREYNKRCEILKRNVNSFFEESMGRQKRKSRDSICEEEFHRAYEKLRFMR